MLDYASLAALAAVIREGSFERAATVLGVTPSAVSQRVKALEERLGTVLVVRGQPCTATATGGRLCAHAERVRLLEGEMAADLPGLAETMAPGPVSLRVAVNADSLGTWFLPAAAAFAEATGTLLDFVLDAEEHTAERLRSGEVLAAVTADPVPVQGCRIVPLGSLRYVATASPGFVARYFAGGVGAESLAQTPALRFDRRDRLQLGWAETVAGESVIGPVHWIPGLRRCGTRRARLGHEPRGAGSTPSQRRPAGRTAARPAARRAALLAACAARRQADRPADARRRRGGQGGVGLAVFSRPRKRRRS
jgi:LysR family transcriptional regulator (chromosome initiation inhibitor)